MLKSQVYIYILPKVHQIQTQSGFMLIPGGKPAFLFGHSSLLQGPHVIMCSSQVQPPSLSLSVFISLLARLYLRGLIFISPLFFFIRCCFNCELCWESWAFLFFMGTQSHLTNKTSKLQASSLQSILCVHFTCFNLCSPEPTLSTHYTLCFSHVDIVPYHKISSNRVLTCIEALSDLS